MPAAQKGIISDEIAAGEGVGDPDRRLNAGRPATYAINHFDAAGAAQSIKVGYQADRLDHLSIQTSTTRRITTSIVPRWSEPHTTHTGMHAEKIPTCSTRRLQQNRIAIVNEILIV